MRRIIVISVLLLLIAVLMAVFTMQIREFLLLPIAEPLSDALVSPTDSPNANMNDSTDIINSSVANGSAEQVEPPSPQATNDNKKATAPAPPGQGTAPVPPDAAPAYTSSVTWSMKLVNETVTDADLDALKGLGITILSGEWGMDEAEPDELLHLLDRVQARGMKMIINFSEGAGWGYAEDGSDGADQKPVWQGARVAKYISAVKSHSAIYGYDISNEAGENLPHGDRFRITLAQMREAAKTVRQADAGRPVIMRMHYWDEEDGDFSWENPFGAGIADIVMLNLYSNYSANRTSPAVPTMVADSGQKLVDKIHAVDSHVSIWISLAAFKELPLFVRPSADDLKRDIAAARTIRGIVNIGFFGLGPERYPSEGKGWYLISDGQDLLKVMREAI